MAAHMRTQIRDAVVDLLIGAAITAKRVYPTRRTPLGAESLPAVLVYTMSEDSQPETLSSPRWLSRDLELMVEAVAQDNAAIDDTLDALAQKIEAAMGGALANVAGPLRQMVRGGDLARTQIGLRPGNPDEKGTGHIVLTYRLNYRTRSDNPTTNT